VEKTQKKYVKPRKNAFNENEEKQCRRSSKRFLSPAAMRTISPWRASTKVPFRGASRKRAFVSDTIYIDNGNQFSCLGIGRKNINFCEPCEFQEWQSKSTQTIGQKICSHSARVKFQIRDRSRARIYQYIMKHTNCHFWKIINKSYCFCIFRVRNTREDYVAFFDNFTSILDKFARFKVLRFL